MATKQFKLARTPFARWMDDVLEEYGIPLDEITNRLGISTGYMAVIRRADAYREASHSGRYNGKLAISHERQAELEAAILNELRVLTGDDLHP